MRTLRSLYEISDSVAGLKAENGRDVTADIEQICSMSAVTSQTAARERRSLSSVEKEANSQEEK